LLDVWADDQGQVIICDTLTLCRERGRPGPIHRARRLSRVPDRTHPLRAARFGLPAAWRATARIQPLPYERNPRTHSEAQVDQIAASMVDFGWTNPILIDENAGILAGHGRL
jgi:ParB/Sulfiredoxin domain